MKTCSLWCQNVSNRIPCHHINWARLQSFRDPLTTFSSCSNRIEIWTRKGSLSERKPLPFKSWKQTTNKWWNIIRTLNLDSHASKSVTKWRCKFSKPCVTNCSGPLTHQCRPTTLQTCQDVYSRGWKRSVLLILSNNWRLTSWVNCLLIDHPFMI